MIYRSSVSRRDLQQRRGGSVESDDHWLVLLLLQKQQQLQWFWSSSFDSREGGLHAILKSVSEIEQAWVGTVLLNGSLSQGAE